MKNRRFLFAFSLVLLIAGAAFYSALRKTGDNNSVGNSSASSAEKSDLSSSGSSARASASAGAAASPDNGTGFANNSSPARPVRASDKKSAKPAGNTAPPVGKQTDADYAILDGGIPRNFVLALDEIWVTDADGKGRVVRVDAASQEQLEQLVLASSASGESAQAVLYEEGVERNEFTRRVVSSLVTVQLSESSEPAEIAQLAGASSFKLPEYAPGFAVLKTGPGLESLRVAEQLDGQPGILMAEAQLARQQSKRAMPNDTLINQQWHLKFNNQTGAVAGTDLNIESVWAYPTAGAGRRGRGVRIGIVDDGLQTSHPDLTTNVDTTNHKDWNGNDNDPSPGAGDDHGTACAGDAAARGNNALGVSGSAPEATLVGMRLIAAATTDTQEAEAMNYLPQIIQIKSNSWGPSDTGTILEAPGPLTKAALQSAAETGRGGKGTISMWAGGNGLDANDNSNYDGYANSIYTIAVGAFDSQSRQAWYSEPGANLVITSPSSGDAPALGKTTTDRTGADGYVAGDYESDFGGTSSATPTAAGVVALMLEANPDLGWRDVQEILMRSAKKVNPSDTDWKTPVAPVNINHNHKFGAGLVDAAAAVALASSWTNLGNQLKRTVAQTGLSVAIPNQNTTGITRELVIPAQDNLRVEHVTVTVNINHTARGNLKITLTSPSGTVSRLAEVHADSGDNFANWTFMTVRNWGENAAGTWRLKITDESGTSNTTGGTLTSATMEVYGSSTAPVNPPPVVTLTSPSGDLVVSPGASVDLAAIANDSTAAGGTGSVTSVEFIANGTAIFTDTAPPYVFPWFPAIGTYTVAARATDSEGASSTSASVTVEVRNQAPTVSSAQIAPSVDAYSDAPLQVVGVVTNDPEGSPVTVSYQWQSSLNGTVWTDMGGTAAVLAANPANAAKLWRCAVRASDGNAIGDPFFTAPVSVGNRPVAAGTLGSSYSFQPAIYVPAVSTTFTRPVIINEFSQGPSSTSEWIELLTLQDTSLAYYDLSDASTGFLLFLDAPVWDNIPAGTVIVIYNGASKDPLVPAEDTNPLDDGRMVLSSLNASYFDQTTSWPALGNSGDAIFVNDADSVTVAQVAYGNNSTATPNIGAVSSGRAAYYIGDTEDGITSSANWFVTTASTARGVRSVQRAPGDLFFSEYVEGTSNNKALEIYNPSGGSVNLSTAGYSVEIYSNGSTSAGTTIALTGTIASGGVFVLKHASASASIAAQQTSASLSFNGDDAVVLKKGTAIVDVIGQIGFDPGTAWSANGVSTLDQTLRRKVGILQGDTNGSDAFNPSLEWEAFGTDIYTGLGSHAGSSDPLLAVSAAPVTFAESGGVSASTGTVIIPSAAVVDLVVALASSNTNAAIVTASVTIPAGQTSASFSISAVDNALSDGTKTVTITATAAGYTNGTVQLTVTDDEPSFDGVTPGKGNNPANSGFLANLRAGTFGQGNLYRTGTGHQMPPGLTLDTATGLLSGTPTQAGTYNVVLESYNALGETATQSFQLTISSGSTGFAAWIAAYPGLLDTTLMGDPDNDRVANIAEYFMGLNPGAADAANAMTVVYTNSNAIHLDYRRDTTASGITNWVKWKDDLASPDSWSTNNVSETVLSNQSNIEWRRATVPVQPGDTRKFLRLEVQQQ